MTFGSLFAGIGGLDLGLERAGMECKWQVEIDDYARRVLAKHWPNVRRWDDIKTFPPNAECDGFDEAEKSGGIAAGKEERRVQQSQGLDSTPRGIRASGTEPFAAKRRPRRSDTKREWNVDLICGGFPCQDISFAGKGAGLQGARSGLFYELVRVVGILRPRYVLLENVAALLRRGMHDVLGTLASIGFDAEWHCLQAADFGAPHIRDRVFIFGWRHLADTECKRQPRSGEPVKPMCSKANEDRQTDRFVPVSQSNQWTVEPSVGGSADGFPSWLVRHIGKGISYETSKQKIEMLRSVWSSDAAEAVWKSVRGLSRVESAEVLFAFLCEYETESELQRVFDSCQEALEDELLGVRLRLSFGIPPQRQGQDQQPSGEYRNALCELSSQWDTFDGGIPRVASGIPNRTHRLRGLGNAVVPQIAEWIGRRIMEAGNA